MEECTEAMYIQEHRSQQREHEWCEQIAQLQAVNEATLKRDQTVPVTTAQNGRRRQRAREAKARAEFIAHGGMTRNPGRSQTPERGRTAPKEEQETDKKQQEGIAIYDGCVTTATSHEFVGVHKNVSSSVGHNEIKTTGQKT